MNLKGRSSLVQYLLFWSGQQLSSFGSSIVSFAIIWWITITTQSAYYLALSSALSFGSMMIVQFFSGYLTDYFNRSWILGFVDFCQAALTLILVWIFYIGQETIIIILTILALRGLFDGLHSPASGAILPTMVPKEELTRINSLTSSSRSLMNLLSPPIAAFLVSSFTSQMWLILLIDAITFIIALIPLLLINIPDIRENHDTTESFLTKFNGGITYLKSSKGLIPLLFIFASFNFFITPVSMLSPLIIMSERGFNSNEFIFALNIILSNLSFLIMSLMLAKYTPKIKENIGVMTGFLVSIIGLCLVILSFYLHLLEIFLIGNFVIGLGFPIINVYSSTIWQIHVPAELQGRIISVRMIITTVSLPLVMIFTGIVAEFVSFFILFLCATIGFSILLGVIWIFSDFKKLDREPIQQITPLQYNSTEIIVSAD